MAAVRWLSPAFDYTNIPATSTVLLFAGLMMIAGALYITLFAVIARSMNLKNILAPCILLGIAMRVIFFGSTPVYEDDWYRYLWDGAATVNGINPYAFAPSQANLVDTFGEITPIPADEDLRKLRSLGADLDHWPERINFPYVTTIYPPVAQAAFAFSHLLSPFDINAWRYVLLLIDFAAVAMILLLLREWKRPALWVLLYWWNPIVILTTFNAGHMDVLLIPFLIGTLLLLAKKRPHFAAVSLGAAAGVKFWPIMLAPLIFRAWRKDIKKLITLALVCGASLIVFLGPMLLSFEFQTSGLSAYANTWIRNAFLFPVLTTAFETITTDSDLSARFISAAVPLGYILWSTFRKQIDIQTLPHSIMVAILLLFIFSPTGYPWYAIWFFMLAPLAPSIGVAAFTITLPIYYLRYSLEYLGQGEYFNAVLVPVEFGIPIFLLCVEVFRTKIARKRNHT